MVWDSPCACACCSRLGTISKVDGVLRHLFVLTLQSVGDDKC